MKAAARIRAATEADCEAIARIYNHYILHTTLPPFRRGFRVWSRSSGWQRWRTSAKWAASLASGSTWATGSGCC